MQRFYLILSPGGEASKSPNRLIVIGAILLHASSCCKAMLQMQVARSSDMQSRYACKDCIWHAGKKRLPDTQKREKFFGFVEVPPGPVTSVDNMHVHVKFHMPCQVADGHD